MGIARDDAQQRKSPQTLREQDYCLLHEKDCCYMLHTYPKTLGNWTTVAAKMIAVAC